MTLDRESAPHGRHELQDEDVVTAARGGETSHAAWSALADELIAALAALDHYLEIKVRTTERNADQDQGVDVPVADVAELHEVREHLHQGAARAVVQLAQLAQVAVFRERDREVATSGTARPWSLDHPLIQLAQAYGAAFGAVESAAQSLARTPAAQVPSAAGRLVELAVRSANGLRQAMDLAFGQQGLGTVQHLCDHIATLENQADTLYHSAVATFLSRRRAAAGQPAQWTAEDAEHIQRLATLEALTDRCEEIAEALLLAEHFL